VKNSGAKNVRNESFSEKKTTKIFKQNISLI